MPTRPWARRGGGGDRGYGQEHQHRTDEATTAEPWCHTWPTCEHADAGTPANPLQGGHLLLRSEVPTEEAWRALPIVAQCRACNTGHRPVLSPAQRTELIGAVTGEKSITDEDRS